MLELDGRTLTSEQFRELCLKPNIPAIIRCAAPSFVPSTGDDGVAPQMSPLDDMRSRLSPVGVLNLFGEDHIVPATESLTVGSATMLRNTEGEPYMKCSEMRLSEVIEHWRSGVTVLYLKDWHMQSDMEALSCSVRVAGLPDSTCVCDTGTDVEQSAGPCGGGTVIHANNLYRVPSYLGADWMDEFCRSSQRCESKYRFFGKGRGDYRFAYIGPPASWTPLHFDVFGTYSWSLNVCGEKLWFFPTPEGNQSLMESGHHGIALPSDIRVTTGVELWTVIQNSGDLVFVPSCYLHQVHNVKGLCFPLPRVGVSVNGPTPSREREGAESETEDGVADLVISINHNWCNEWCVERMVDAFCRDSNRLGALLGREERMALFDDDVEAWHNHLEALFIGGTNWNFGCIRSFLVHRLQILQSSVTPVCEDEDLRQLITLCLEKIDEREMHFTHSVDN